jgi:hypothetical protein
MLDNHEASLNYLVRLGYSWTELRGMPAYRIRRLCKLNNAIDDPPEDGYDPDADQYTTVI